MLSMAPATPERTAARPGRRRRRPEGKPLAKKKTASTGRGRTPDEKTHLNDPDPAAVLDASVFLHPPPPRDDAPPEFLDPPDLLVVDPELSAQVPPRRVRPSVVRHEDRVVLPHPGSDEPHRVPPPRVVPSPPPSPSSSPSSGDGDRKDRRHRRDRRDAPQSQLAGLVPAPPVRDAALRYRDGVAGRGGRGDERDFRPGEDRREEDGRRLQLVRGRRPPAGGRFGEGGPSGPGVGWMCVNEEEKKSG